MREGCWRVVSVVVGSRSMCELGKGCLEAVRVFGDLGCVYDIIVVDLE